MGAVEGSLGSVDGIVGSVGSVEGSVGSVGETGVPSVLTSPHTMQVYETVVSSLVTPSSQLCPSAEPSVA